VDVVQPWAQEVYDEAVCRLMAWLKGSTLVISNNLDVPARLWKIKHSTKVILNGRKRMQSIAGRDKRYNQLDINKFGQMAEWLWR
jgi:hypothetical protein